MLSPCLYLFNPISVALSMPRLNHNTLYNLRPSPLLQNQLLVNVHMNLVVLLIVLTNYLLASCRNYSLLMLVCLFFCCCCCCCIIMLILFLDGFEPITAKQNVAARSTARYFFQRISLYKSNNLIHCSPTKCFTDALC